MTNRPKKGNMLYEKTARKHKNNIFEDKTSEVKYRWDGTDFIAWGLKSPNGKPHNKFSEYKFIQINQYILSSYEKAQISKYKNGVVTYYGHKYSIPASVFTNSSNMDPHRGFYYKTGNKEQYGIEATGVAGRTIFWRLKL